MGYALQAVVARTEQLEGKLRQRHAHLVPLEQHFSLIPVTPDLYDEVNRFAASGATHGFVFLSARVRGWLEELSLGGSLAYVEAEIFGGTGTQSACVYENGSCVLEPFTSNRDAQQNERTKVPLADDAINAALRRLGAIVVQGSVDEFDSVGLGRARHTDDWLKK